MKYRIIQTYNIKEKKIDISANSLDRLLKLYRESINSIEGKEEYFRNSRIKLSIDIDDRDYKEIYYVLKAISPIIEILLDKGPMKNGKHLSGYIDYGSDIRLEDGKMICSLGDGGRYSIDSSVIYLVYNLIYDDNIYMKLREEFSLMTEKIWLGGYRSAHFNGLEGYYYSRYFFVWIYYLVDLLYDLPGIDREYLNIVINYVDNFGQK